MGRCSAVPQLILLIGFWLFGPSASQAALFNITYDNIGDQTIGTGAIVGTGAFSFSGPAETGNFLLSALPDLAFSASFGDISFSTADIISNLNLTGVAIFARDAGEFGLVFTGNTGGSLDARNGLNSLSHEPTGGLGNPKGCCGGSGETNLYFVRRNERIFYFGDYYATTASTVPAPTSLALVGLGLLGLARATHRGALSKRTAA